MHPRILATSVTLPLEILRAAAQTQRRPDAVNVRFFAADPGPLTVDSGVTFDTLPLPPRLDADVVLVPAIWRNPRWAERHCPQHSELIGGAIDAGATVCAVGSGSFLVAASGRLDGGAATTHWRWFDRFARAFPRVELRRDHVITQHHRVFCAGSVNSIADLMVYLVREWFSDAIATAVENQFSPEIRQAFAPSALPGSAPAHSDELIHELQLHLASQLRDPPAVAAMAARLGVTQRTLQRRFRRATGLSPGAYIKRLRLREARALLQHSNLAVSEVAWTVGYNDRSRFAADFRIDYGVTPKHYREAVRGKTFRVADPLDPAP